MALIKSLAFTLGASLSKEHATTIGRVQTDLVALRGEAKKLGQTAKDADRFGKALDGFNAASVTVADAEDALAKLRAEAEKNPSEKLAAKIAKASRALQQAKDKAAQSKERLGQLGKSLRDAGVDTGKLEHEQQRLGKSLEATRQQMDRLNAVAARRKQVGQAFGEAASRTGVAVGSAVAFGAAVGKPVSEAATFNDQVRQIAITGEFAGTAQERQLGSAISATSLNTGQSTAALTDAVNVIVAGGVEGSKLPGLVPIIGNIATATRASAEDIGKTFIALDQNLGISNPKEQELAFNQLAKAGKLGNFEIKDIAASLPALGASMASLGIKGNEAAVELGAALQIVRRGAGSSEEAANNLKNLLNKITSKETSAAFAKIGIDVRRELSTAAAKGVSPLTASVDLFMQAMKRGAPAAAAQINGLASELEAIKDPAARAAELQRRTEQISALAARAGLSSVLVDQQALAAVVALSQNRAEFEQLKTKTRSGKNDKGQFVIDADFALQQELLTNRSRLAGSAISALGRTIGDSLTPVVGPMIDLFTSAVVALVKLGAAFPKTTTVIATAAAVIGGGLVVGKIALAVQSIFRLGSALRALGAAQRVAAGGGLLSRALAVMAPAAKNLGAALSGVLFSGLKLAGRGVLILGRAFLLNPIGIAVTVIAGAAFLIWKNWSKIGPALRSFWGGIKGAATKAWSGIKGVAGTVFDASKKAFSFTPLGLVVNNWGSIKGFFGNLGERLKPAFNVMSKAAMNAFKFSPLGLVVNNWGSIMTFFKTLPAKMLTIGGQIIDGLLGGITAGWDRLKAGVTNIGDGIANQFKSVLGINSPSRVFMGLGDMLGVGLQQGMLGTARAVAGAALALATAATPDFSGSAGTGVGVAAAAATGAASASAGVSPQQASAAMQITIGPINITQQAGEDAEALADRVAAAIERKAGRIRRSALGDIA